MREHRFVFTGSVEVMSTGICGFCERTWVCVSWMCRGHVHRCSVREHGFVFTGCVEVMSTGICGFCERTWVCVYWVCRSHV